MRYYELTLMKPGTTEPIRQWSSHPKEQRDPGALNIEFDIPVYNLADPDGMQTIQLEGVSMQDIMQSTTFSDLDFTLKAGMKAGLPLVNPGQAGLIAQGTVFQSFGHWESNEMYVDFIVSPPLHSLASNPGNIVLNWKSGKPLEQALKHTLSTAYPKVKTEINISPDLVVTNDEVSFHGSLNSLAALISKRSKEQGHQVYMDFQVGSIKVQDDTYKPDPIQIAFTDLVGQPAWIDVNIMQMKLVMRSDLNVGGYVLLPPGMQSQPGMVTTQSASMPSSMKYQTSFKGKFMILAERHIGNFRASDGGAWVTVINCTPESANG